MTGVIPLPSFHRTDKAFDIRTPTVLELGWAFVTLCHCLCLPIELIQFQLRCDPLICSWRCSPFEMWSSGEVVSRPIYYWKGFKSHAISFALDSAQRLPTHNILVTQHLVTRHNAIISEGLKMEQTGLTLLQLGLEENLHRMKLFHAQSRWDEVFIKCHWLVEGSLMDSHLQHPKTGSKEENLN